MSGDPSEHPDSYWRQTTGEIPTRNRLQGSREVEVAVIGGGFTGLAAAYFLGERGVSTAVLEKNRVGWGASGRNGGFLITRPYKKGFQEMVDDEGEEYARKMLEIGTDSVDLVEDLVQTHGIDCHFDRCGSLLAAYKSSHLDKLKKYRDFMASTFDYEMEIVGRDRMGEELGSPLYHGVLLDPQSGSFHPLRYALGLAEAAESKGTTIYEHSEVEEIRRNTDGATLVTSDSEIQASRVIVATNGYTPSCVPDLERSIFAIYSYIIATEPLEESLAREIIPRNRVVSDSKKFLYYYRLSPDEEQRMLFGSPVSFLMDEGPELYKEARRQMLSVFPQLEDHRIEFQWGGRTGFPLDQMPHLGQTNDGLVHYGLGYSGTGAALSTLMGRFLARQVQGESMESNPLTGGSLRSIPLHSQRWLLEHMANIYYRFRDWIY